MTATSEPQVANKYHAAVYSGFFSIFFISDYVTYRVVTLLSVKKRGTCTWQSCCWIVGIYKQSDKTANSNISLFPQWTAECCALLKLWKYLGLKYCTTFLNCIEVIWVLWVHVSFSPLQRFSFKLTEAQTAGQAMFNAIRRS